MVISSLALSFSLVVRASSPRLGSPTGEKGRGGKVPRHDQAKAADGVPGALAYGARAAEGRIREFAGTTASNLKSQEMQNESGKTSLLPVTTSLLVGAWVYPTWTLVSP